MGDMLGEYAGHARTGMFSHTLYSFLVNDPSDISSHHWTDFTGASRHNHAERSHHATLKTSYSTI